VSVDGVAVQMAALVTADERGWLALAYAVFVGGIIGVRSLVLADRSSVLFLGDRVTPTLIVGALLAISGVAITRMKPAPGQIEPESHVAATILS
jgi:O-acetylserine/cysteine efflux transporter